MNEIIENLIRTRLSQAIDAIDPYIGLVYEHEDSFLAEFCQGDATDVISVSLSSERVHFVYLLSSGQHLQYDTTIEEFTDWILSLGEGLEL